ncbi:MAG: FAD-dependent oxidoreductase [Hormoscilla sp. SP12CHS1]|nr:FAD-dependent oxidoreductase [Hormoscilla sp. SP12CHS1]
MTLVIIIGCGAIGAMTAYELSQVQGLQITVIDKQPPAQAATGAALGVMMGIISGKVKGRAWELRQTSIRRYETLITELEEITQGQIPFNRQGILKLCTESEELEKGQQLAEIRRSQGWQLEIWDADRLLSHCPHLSDRFYGAIYSPQDRQVDPTALTHALVTAAQGNGVTFKFGVNVEGLATSDGGRCLIQTNAGNMKCDRLVIAAGLGSTELTKSLQKTIDIRPVLGQAVEYGGVSLGNQEFQPAITTDDIHIVPVGDCAARTRLRLRDCAARTLGERNYWVGSTVEFPTATGEIVADPRNLQVVKEKAIAICPALADGAIVKQWSGLRPRPEVAPAPIIGHMPGDDNILLATGHYRNGILLAPATAQAIRKAIA